MLVCKRTSDDPLLKAFLDKYHLNLLSVPRDGSRIGDLYVHANGRTSSPGNVSHFLKPQLELPEVKADEHMADVQGMATNAVAFSIGLGLLEGFFAALGVLGTFQSIEAEYS